MKQTLGDKIMSKVTNNRINTIRTTADEMADMVDEYFIQKAVTEQDFKDIWTVIKRGLFFDKVLKSKDENYELRSESSQGGRNLKRYVWILDKSQNTFYEYNYYVGFYGKFKKMMRERLESAKKEKNIK